MPITIAGYTDIVLLGHGRYGRLLRARRLADGTLVVGYEIELDPVQNAVPGRYEHWMSFGSNWSVSKLLARVPPLPGSATLGHKYAFTPSASGPRFSLSLAELRDRLQCLQQRPDSLTKEVPNPRSAIAQIFASFPEHDSNTIDPVIIWDNPPQDEDEDEVKDENIWQAALSMWREVAETHQRVARKLERLEEIFSGAEEAK